MSESPGADASRMSPSFGAMRVIPKMTSQELHTQGQKTNKRPLGPAAHVLGCPGLPACTQGPPSMVAPVGGATIPRPPPARPLVPEAGSSENTDEQGGPPARTLEAGAWLCCTAQSDGPTLLLPTVLQSRPAPCLW